jgi:NAD(P)-dependent dehydrogenase (short-subunit alcohol dehydrogenase family)
VSGLAGPARASGAAPLEGRTILVTGGAQGIGAAIATSVAAKGANVCIADLRAPDEVVESIVSDGGRAVGVVCDITSPDDVRLAVEASLGEFGGIDGLVNNAAMFSSLRPTPFTEITSEEFDRVLQVNVRGTFEVLKAVIPEMRTRGYGKVVNIASSTFFKGAAYLLHYVSSKGAVIAMTRGLAREVGPDGIRVNCVAPGLTMSDGVLESQNLPRERIEADLVTRCLAREQLPEDVTGVVAFLLSADSDFMTGQTVVVDGGSMLH